MAWFIKTERFTSETMSLSQEKRQYHINQHCSWVIHLNKLGIKVVSGYLVDKLGRPGGGGLLILEAESFNEARCLIEKDPMIISGLVNWELQEWKKVHGEAHL